MGILVDVLVLLGRLLKVLFETIVRWVTPASYKSVEGEVCLITGSGSGIGRLMALEFARREATLILWDVDEAGNEETLRLVREQGANAFADTCDVTSSENIKEAAARARKKIGEVTILVNNAGVTYGKELLDLTEKQIETTYKVNTLAHAWTLREFLPHMMETNHGHIVTIASTVGLFATAGMPDYTSSKFASVGLHQSLYLDLKNAGKNGVKTTLVCPYLISTGMFTGVEISRTSLCPPLDPKECVDTIMHAVLTERYFVAIPRLMYISYFMSTFLPMEAQHAMYVFMGADRAISKFRPSRKYQFE